MIKTSNFAEFQQQMIAYAKSATRDNYPGDDYYKQDCWRESFDAGDTPSGAVQSDISYWEPEGDVQ